MTKVQRIAVFFIALAAWGFGLAHAGQPAVGEDGLRTLAQSNNAYAWELHQKLMGQKGNLFYSPYSISSVLAPTYAGARGNTEQQMRDVLHFEQDSKHLLRTFRSMNRGLEDGAKKHGYELGLANALWVSKGHTLLPEYGRLVRNDYGAGLDELDFAANPEASRQSINLWIEKQTAGQVKDLLPAGTVTAATRLVLTNAISFKGTWATPFAAENTSVAPFTLSRGGQVDVPMMNQTGEFRFMEDATFQALELPYVGNQVSMVVLLPKRKEGLAALEKLLQVENVDRWLGKLSKQEVSVYLPRFTMTGKLFLSDTLKAMGMSDAFSSSNADFSGIDGTKSLAISQVVHQAFVEVNEKGTKAAAATATTMMESMNLPGKEFRADHPFVFLIRDTTHNAILFIGRVENPDHSAQSGR